MGRWWSRLRNACAHSLERLTREQLHASKRSFGAGCTPYRNGGDGSKARRPLAGRAPPRLLTALGFMTLGSIRCLLSSFFVFAFGTAGTTITSTSSAVRPRSAGKRRDVIELVKSSAAMERRSAEQQNDRDERFAGERGGARKDLYSPQTPTPPTPQNILLNARHVG